MFTIRKVKYKFERIAAILKSTLKPEEPWRVQCNLPDIEDNNEAHIFMCHGFSPKYIRVMFPWEWIHNSRGNKVSIVGFDTWKSSCYYNPEETCLVAPWDCRKRVLLRNASTSKKKAKSCPFFFFFSFFFLFSSFFDTLQEWLKTNQMLRSRPRRGLIFHVRFNLY